MHLALGGCLKAPPIRYGITADTGGHIAYVLEAALAQGAMAAVDGVSVVTRLFEDDRLGEAHRLSREHLAEGVTIDRIATANRTYLEKEALGADLLDFIAAFDAWLATLPRLPDVIHAHFADAATLAIAVRARRGIPFVFTPHALGIDKRDQGRDQGRDRQGTDAGLQARIAEEACAIAEADAIIVSSHDEADRQIGAYGVAAANARIHRIAPGVPGRLGVTGVDDGLGLWRAPLAAPDKPVVLAIARPVRKKNLAALVRAFAGDAGLHDRANLVILAGQHDARDAGGEDIGEEGAVLAELHRLAADPRLRGRVALPPRHDRGDVETLYRLAAQGGVFVNPALHEPFGLTVIEAAAAGVPVVVTANGGPREIVAAIGHGLLVDPRDEAGIAAACRRLIDDPALHARMADAARRNVQHYSWRVYAERSVALYAGLAAAPRLLACDIDNTLTGCATGARAFAHWCATRPVPFVVATGRSFAAARAVLGQWQLPTPDAFIVDVGTRIMTRAADDDWAECPAFATSLDPEWDRDAVVAALATLPLRPQPAETAGPHKLSFFGTSADAMAIEATLASAGLKARVIFSHDRLIDVLAPRAGKAAAIAAYAAGHGLTLADCIAAGDSGNDRDMLDACGHAIVVANAGAELDGLVPRAGLRRVRGRHAAGVMEGLAAVGLAVDAPQEVAA